MAARSSCRLERWLTPRRRRASFPASRLGSGTGGKPLARINASLLLRRHGRRRRIGRVSLSLTGIASRRRGRRRMQRRQMHVVAMRRQWRCRNLLIGIVRRGDCRRRRRVLTAEMQPFLNVLRAPGDAAQHPAGLARGRRGDGDCRRSSLRCRSLDVRWRRVCDALLVRVGHGDLHHGGHWLRPVIEDDFLRSARQRRRRRRPDGSA
jgi:hypothetical protein